MSDDRKGTDTDDMALVADLIARIRDRLEPLEDVERVASRKDLDALVDQIGRMRIMLDEKQLKELREAAELGANNGHNESSRAYRQRLDSAILELKNNQDSYLRHFAGAAKEARAQSETVRRWKWWGLGGTLTIGLLCGALLVTVITVRSDVLTWAALLQNVSTSREACTLLGKSYEDAQTGIGPQCIIPLPERS